MKTSSEKQEFRGFHWHILSFKETSKDVFREKETDLVRKLGSA